MKKIWVLCSLLMLLICNGCSCDLSLFDDDKEITCYQAPTTLVNNTFVAEETDLESLYDGVRKSVVTVLNYTSYYSKGQKAYNLYGTGSGFVYDYDDNYIYIYTNAHVVSVDINYNQSHYEVVFHDETRYYAELLYSDGAEDVAIMKVENKGQDFLVAALGNSDNLNPGQSVFAIGSPLGLDYNGTITSGIISNVKVTMDTDDDDNGSSTTMYLIQVDVALNPGNSGGPLFNMNGQVVGVNTLKIMTDSSGSDVESFNFCIPINHFVVVANSLIENNGTYARPKLGISIMDISEMSLKTREGYSITIQNGIYIDSVSSTKTSLKAKTVITKINDVKIVDIGDFATVLYRYYSGDTISVTTVGVDGSNEVTHSIVLG